MQRPFKLLDDALDACRSLAAQYFPVIADLSKEQELDRRLPSLFKQDNLIKTLTTGGAAAMHSYEDYLKEARRELDEDASMEYYRVGA